MNKHTKLERKKNRKKIWIFPNNKIITAWTWAQARNNNWIVETTTTTTTSAYGHIRQNFQQRWTSSFLTKWISVSLNEAIIVDGGGGDDSFRVFGWKQFLFFFRQSLDYRGHCRRHADACQSIGRNFPFKLIVVIVGFLHWCGWKSSPRTMKTIAYHRIRSLSWLLLCFGDKFFAIAVVVGKN